MESMVEETPNKVRF